MNGDSGERKAVVKDKFGIGGFGPCSLEEWEDYS